MTTGGMGCTAVDPAHWSFPPTPWRLLGGAGRSAVRRGMIRIPSLGDARERRGGPSIAPNRSQLLASSSNRISLDRDRKPILIGW